MPRIWEQTIDAHRRTLRDSILDATAELVQRRGLRAVTMSEIAESTGVGRATLYKYFQDVDAVLMAWHERAIASHFAHLSEATAGATDAGERLERAVTVYAHIAHESGGRHDAELAALMHRDENVAEAAHRLRDFFRDVIATAASAGEARGDVSAHELALYCIHALNGAGGLPSKAAVTRLAGLVLSGLRPQA